MLKAEFNEQDDLLTIRIEGRLTGPFAEDLMHRVIRINVPTSLFVDLSELTFVDDLGEELLSWLARLGGTFIPGNIYSAGVCERLQLPQSQVAL